MLAPIQIWYDGHSHPTALPILADETRPRYWWRALAHVNQYIAPSMASFVLFDDLYRVTYHEGAPDRLELEVLMTGMLEEEREERVLEHALEIAGASSSSRRSRRSPQGDARRRDAEAYADTSLVVVEDDDAHAALIEGYVRSVGYDGLVQRYTDGQQTLNNIEHDVQSTRALMFLDIRLPRINGFDVLRWMKASPTRRVIPVVMLSTSTSATDVKSAYSLGANGYLIKQLDPVAFFEMIQWAMRYWFRWNRMR